MSGVRPARRWVPLATLGGVAFVVATGPAEAWQPTRLMAVGLAWAAVAVLAERAAGARRRLAEQEAARQVAEERLRIARELHDILSHSLATISLRAGIGLHLVDRQPGEAGEALRAIRWTSTAALTQARAALAAVRGAESTAVGLDDLAGLAASVRAAGVGVDLANSVSGQGVPDAVGAVAFRVVQEALTNVMRHAGPGTHVHARVGLAGDRLEVEVTDDGACPAALEHVPGHGLRGLAERVATLDGELHAGPAADGGFTVLAHLPLGRGG